MEMRIIQCAECKKTKYVRVNKETGNNIRSVLDWLFIPSLSIKKRYATDDDYEYAEHKDNKVDLCSKECVTRYFGNVWDNLTEEGVKERKKADNTTKAEIMRSLSTALSTLENIPKTEPNK